jgi:peroxiredoxin
MKHLSAIEVQLLVMLAWCSFACSRNAERSSQKTESASSPSASHAAPRFTAATPKAYDNPTPARIGVLAPGTGVPVGEHAPQVHALDLEGRPVSLASLYEQGPVLLVFYRGGWCPYCNMEIHSLAQAFPEYQKRHVTPVALSVDLPEAESVLKATYHIPFPVLSDTSAESLLAFRVLNKVDEGQVTKMKSFGVDLEAYSGESHHAIAIPSLFLIDKTGTVRWAHSDPDYKLRPSTAQILAAIDQLGLS